MADVFTASVNRQNTHLDGDKVQLPRSSFSPGPRQVQVQAAAQCKPCKLREVKVRQIKARLDSNKNVRNHKSHHKSESFITHTHSLTHTRTCLQDKSGLMSLKRF